MTTTRRLPMPPGVIVEDEPPHEITDVGADAERCPITLEEAAEALVVVLFILEVERVLKYFVAGQEIDVTTPDLRLTDTVFTDQVDLDVAHGDFTVVLEGDADLGARPPLDRQRPAGLVAVTMRMVAARGVRI